MAISEAYSGTETVTTTEWSLTSDSAVLGAITDDGIYQLFLDLNAVTTADLFEVSFYEKVQSGSTQRVFWSATLSQQSDPLWVSPSMILLHGWEMTLIKLSGTDRSILWSIRKVT
jgi:hypothetical protein